MSTYLPCLSAIIQPITCRQFFSVHPDESTLGLLLEDDLSCRGLVVPIEEWPLLIIIRSLLKNSSHGIINEKLGLSLPGLPDNGMAEGKAA